MFVNVMFVIKNYVRKLDFMGHLKRIPKPFNDQNLVSFLCVTQKMKLKDQIILEIFYIKETNNLIR